jgi:hypothetical protein
VGSALHLGLDLAIPSRYSGLDFGFLMARELRWEAYRDPHGLAASSMLQWLLTMSLVAKCLV